MSEPSGSIDVIPTATTTGYTLIATGPGGTATAAITLTVNPPPPTIKSFTVTPNTIKEGDGVTVSWDTTNAESVEIMSEDSFLGSSIVAGTGFVPRTPPGFDPVTAHSALVDRAAGYFANDGGTGGQGGTVIYVTNLNDAGAGSLRDEAESAPTKIILFEDGLAGTINLLSPIDVASNKTIWGRHRDGTGADIFVNPAITSAAAFRMKGGVSNIIITNLKGDADGIENDKAPDWALVNASSLVWIDHCTTIGDGSNNMDGSVDTTGLCTGITISWMRIEDWSGVHGIRDGTKATLHHNYWRSCRDRTPKSVDAGSNAHCYNNWTDQWDNAGMDFAPGPGELRADNNIFDAGADKDAIKDLGGKWDGGGNVLTNGATVPAKDGTTFTPPYSDTIEDISTAPLAQALRDKITAQAGWQATFP